jgi:glutaredoxin
MSNSTTSVPDLYVKTGCPWCLQATTELDRQGIAYRTHNVSTDRAAYAAMEKLSGQTKAPVLDYHGDILADFGAEELIPFLAARPK